MMTTRSTQISNEKYHADDAISASMQKVMVSHGPRAYWNSFLKTGQNINQQVLCCLEH